MTVESVVADAVLIAMVPVTHPDGTEVPNWQFQFPWPELGTMGVEAPTEAEARARIVETLTALGWEAPDG